MSNGNDGMMDVFRIDDNIEDLILRDNDIMIEVINSSKSGLILDTSNTSSLASTQMITWVINRVGNKVTKYKVGDKVLMVTNMNTLHGFEKGEDNYLLTDEYNIKLAVGVKDE